MAFSAKNPFQDSKKSDFWLVEEAASREVRSCVFPMEESMKPGLAPSSSRLAAHFPLGKNIIAGLASLFFAVSMNAGSRQHG